MVMSQEAKKEASKRIRIDFVKTMHSMGFEPTSTNTLELESSPLDRSGTNAVVAM